MGGGPDGTDSWASALLGGGITIGILRGQMLCYHENEEVTMTGPLSVPRTLPEALLSGQSTLTGRDVVSAVAIQSNGTISAA